MVNIDSSRAEDARDPWQQRPLDDRLSFLHVNQGNLYVEDQTFIWQIQPNELVQVPVGAYACILLEPLASISHAAVSLAARVGSLILWVDQDLTAIYAAGREQSWQHERLLRQARIKVDESASEQVIRFMYAQRLGRALPVSKSLAQLKLFEKVRVRKQYQAIAKSFGIAWEPVHYDPKHWDANQPLNRGLGIARACLYGISEAAIRVTGCSPSLGFIHHAGPLSFVKDIAELVQFEALVPMVFKVVAEKSRHLERDIREGCREVFRRTRLLARLLHLIDDILEAGELKNVLQGRPL